MTGESGIYCTQCGKKARPGAAYCAHCGAQLVQATQEERGHAESSNESADSDQRHGVGPPATRKRRSSDRRYLVAIAIVIIVLAGAGTLTYIALGNKDRPEAQAVTSTKSSVTDTSERAGLSSQATTEQTGVDPLSWTL